MKNWIAGLQDKDIQDILKKPQVLKKIPEHLDSKLKQDIYRLMQRKPQKKIPVVLRFSLAALFLIFIGLSIYIYLYFTSPQSGLRIQSISGQVEISRNEQNITLKAGDIIESNDIIITGPNAHCKLQINQDTVITLEQNTKINMEQLQLEQLFTEIKLLDGYISIEISKAKEEPHLTVKTPSAAIMGTYFSVSYNTKMESTFISSLKDSVYVEYLNKDRKMEEFVLNPRESIQLIDKDTDSEPQEEKTLPQIEQDVWKTKQIFKAREAVLGFTRAADKIIAQTRIELVCLDNTHNIIWSRSYRAEPGIAFMGLPLIHDKKVICSSVNKMITILNLETGGELKRIQTSGNINFGNHMVAYQDRIYLPFATGIYVMDISALNPEPELIIAFNNPTTPIIKKNIIYLTSFVTNQVAAFSLQGEELWSFDREYRSYSSPVLIDDYLYTADSRGNLYKIGLSGELINKIKINHGITSCLKAVTDKLFVLADDGLLYQLDADKFQIDRSYSIDQEPDPEAYIYKSPHISLDKLFIGTDKGEINIISRADPRDFKIIHISDSSISCTMQNMDNDFYIGCQNGEIHVIFH